MYYNKKDSSYRIGPGTIISYDNKHVFVSHGGTYIWVSPCNLQLVNKVEEDLSTSDDCQKCSDMIDLQKESKVNEVDEDSDTNDVILDLQDGKQRKYIRTWSKWRQWTANMINQIDLHTDNANPTKKKIGLHPH